MGPMRMVLIAFIIAASHVGGAVAQTTNPQEVLEDVQRDRTKRDKRLERDAAEQQQRDKENMARQLEAGRKPDAATVRGAEGTH